VVAKAVIATLRTYNAHDTIVRGYRATTGPHRSQASALLEKYAYPTTQLFAREGFVTTETVGFSTLVSPTKANLELELKDCGGSGPTTEWMVHIADYVETDARLSLKRDDEFALVSSRPVQCKRLTPMMQPVDPLRE
jgi:hypothetical protein